MKTNIRSVLDQKKKLIVHQRYRDSLNVFPKKKKG